LGEYVIRVVGAVAYDSVHVEADPWIPLKVSWQLTMRTGLLNLYVRGSDGGYVEIRVDSQTGALAELVVIDDPPECPVPCSPPAAPLETGVPTLDRAMWEWRTTPDYTEPVSRDISIEQRLFYSTSESLVALRFADTEVARSLGSEDAQVGVSVDGELVCIVVKKPNVGMPAGYPV
jgi:hypothetical protein